MADLNDIYGENYQNDSKNSKNNYVINTVANNIAHRQFNFKLFDSSELWDLSNGLSPHVIDLIKQKISNINKQMYLFHIDKKSNSINMLPELVIDSPVEYFWIIDGEYQRAYFIYITPREVTAY